MKDKYSFTLTTLKVPSRWPPWRYLQGTSEWLWFNTLRYLEFDFKAPSRYLYSKVPSFQGTLVKPKRLKGTLKKLKVPSRCALNVSRYLQGTFKAPARYLIVHDRNHLEGTFRKLKVPSRCTLNVSRYLQGTLNWHSRYLRTVLVHHLEVPWTSSRYLEKSQGTTLNLKVPIRSPYRYLEIQGGTLKVPWKRSRYLEGVSQKLPQGTLRRLKVVRFSHYDIILRCYKNSYHIDCA